jgi:hypothetical protein
LLLEKEHRHWVFLLDNHIHISFIPEISYQDNNRGCEDILDVFSMYIHILSMQLLYKFMEGCVILYCI